MQLQSAGMCVRAFMCDSRDSSVEVCWVNYNCRIYNMLQKVGCSRIGGRG